MTLPKLPHPSTLPMPALDFTLHGMTPERIRAYVVEKTKEGEVEYATLYGSAVLALGPESPEALEDAFTREHLESAARASGDALIVDDDGWWVRDLKDPNGARIMQVGNALRAGNYRTLGDEAPLRQMLLFLEEAKSAHRVRLAQTREWTSPTGQALGDNERDARRAILARVHERQPALASVFAHAQIFEMTPERATLGYEATSFLYAQAVESRALDLLTSAVRSHFNSDTVVKVVKLDPVSKAA